MVDEHELEALDTLVWLTGSYRAALITYSNQSTIIRRAKKVLSIFGGKVLRTPSGWWVGGASDLLYLERAVHQHFRFRGRRPLRLHTPFWSSLSLVGLCLPNDQWILNPPDLTFCCNNPIDLLHRKVIDACLVTPTQLEGISSDQAAKMTIIPLYRSLIDLFIWPESEDGAAKAVDPQSCNSFGGGGGLNLPALHLFPFLPVTCRIRSKKWFDDKWRNNINAYGISAADNDTSMYKAAFLTPQMIKPLNFSGVKSLPANLPYVESLVFLSKHAGEPAIHRLTDVLENHFASMAFR